MTEQWKNRLYFGDNLAWLNNTKEFPDDSIDVIYLDPPFNSQANYNILFDEKTGEKSSAQITVFKDTWHWGQEAESSYHDAILMGSNLARLMTGLREFLGRSDMMAYLSMMAPRLAELHRVLKPTGSIFVHCDPTASHYLRQILDAIFGPKRFQNEIVWRRSSAHSDTKQGMRRCGRIHDIIFFYGKGKNKERTFNPIYTEYTDRYLQSEYRHKDKDGRRFKQTDLTAAKPGGDVEYRWHIKKKTGRSFRWQADLTNAYKNPQDGWEYKPVKPYQGRYWGYSKANLVAFEKAGKMHYRKTGMPRLKQYADEMPGIPLQDLWDDILPVTKSEDLGYPTQKPRVLLQRILEMSSNEGDIVLDPFCGCGTAIDAAEKLKRRWIGIDITHLAITLIRHRLSTKFGNQLSSYRVEGQPTDVAGAKALAIEDRYKFQTWALGTVEARPSQDKKGADKGLDGLIYFFDDESGKPKKAVVSVKSGHVSIEQIRSLNTVRERENAEIGVFLTLEEPTGPMRTEAVAAGYYIPEYFPSMRVPRLQILTIREVLLEGKEVLHPRVARPDTFRSAQQEKPTTTGRKSTPVPEQGSLL